MYVAQQAQVSWAGVVSDYFPVDNDDKYLSTKVLKYVLKYFLVLTYLYLSILENWYLVLILK